MEYIINDFIFLKLIKGKTAIYINKEPFINCKCLLLNKSFKELDDILLLESVDDLEDHLESSLEVVIKPETEFWAHCSNLQAWYESDYDSKLLHRSLAFPLLKKLAEAGDKRALQVFKKEIAKRFLHGNSSVSTYLIVEGYLDYLDIRELWALFHPIESNFLEDLEKVGISIRDILRRCVFERGKIITLNLAELGLGTLPASLSDLKSLIHLDASGNNLEEFPSSALLLESLEIYDLSNNKISSIPESVLRLKSLRILRLIHNNLLSLPQSLSAIKSLEVLNLDENSIVKIPDSIGKMENLKELTLDSNCLKEVPLSLKDLNSLETLVLSYNKLTSFPDILPFIENLKFLSFNGNNFIDLPTSLKDEL